MKPDNYAHALLRLTDEGEKPSVVVERMHALLKRQGRTSLLPQIARAFSRLAQRKMQKNRTVLYVAKKSDEKEARAASRSETADVRLDETLIGGWRLEDNERMIDASWKKHLLSIYNRITA